MLAMTAPLVSVPTTTSTRCAMRERPTTLREARERFGNVPQKRIAILRRERPRRCRAAEQRDELAPPCMSRKEHCEG
jgi:hypothetical protein